MSNELKVTELDQAMAEIKRQAAEIERLQHWQRAVDDACTVSWVPVTDDARETVKALIARECQIALDPLVSSDAQALMDRGKEEAAAEIERLKTRLEVSPDHDYDGIYCRDATIKLQDERIAEIQAENASIRELLSKKVVDSTMLTDLGIRGGGINATFEGGAAGLIATTFAEQFREAGATNYLELTFEDKELGEFVVTMQRKDGETPGYQKAKAEARAAELEQDAARYRYIRTHRIGVKWCELYAGGPALDEVIDSTMKEAGPSPINSAALRAAEQAAAEGRTESVIAIYRAIREAQIDLPPPSSSPSSGLDFP